MKMTFKLMCVLILVLGAYMLFNKVKSEKLDVSVIPKPNTIDQGDGVFTINKKTKLCFDDFKFKDRSSVLFINELKQATGINLSYTKLKSSSNVIVCKKVEDIKPEAYNLIVSEDFITIEACSNAGLYYGLQTLKQIVCVNTDIPKYCEVPVVSISDSPEFKWRGYMLDVSRHFYGPRDIKKVLDFMGSLKLNRFHWHLADDQGWRIEIKKYPKLTGIGAWRVDYNTTDEKLATWWKRPVQKEGEEATYGGFYTQGEIEDIIQYAKDRNIEILPEIDIPGHSQEIIAAYPEYACKNKTYYVATGGVKKNNTLCPSNEKTYTFLEDVLTEVMELFPFGYIHIGGDECNKEDWENHKQCQDFIKKNGLKDEKGLQSYFIGRIEKFINSKGKKMIGWDEILEGGLAPNATVMSWRGETGGIKSVKFGHDVIMCPNKYNYLDLKQGQSDFEPNFGYGKALLSSCYNYHVIPKDFTPEQAKHILGTQGNLWTESISDWDKLTYMTFPRLFAVAENAWTSEKNQNFSDFLKRLKPQLSRFDLNNVRYAKSVYNVWVREKGNGKTIEITLHSEIPSADIRYTLDGSDPVKSSLKYNKPFIIKSTKLIKTATFENGERLGNIIEVNYPIHKAAGSKIVYNCKHSEGDNALTDLSYGEFLDNKGKGWQKFPEGVDVDIIFKNPKTVSAVCFTSLKNTPKAVYPPSDVEIFGIDVNDQLIKLATKGFLNESLIQGENKVNMDFEFKEHHLKLIRIKAKTVGVLSEEHHAVGQKSSIMIDEIRVD